MENIILYSNAQLEPWFVFIPWKGFYDFILFIFPKFVYIEHEASRNDDEK